MRFLFAGTPCAALPRDVAALGHEVRAPEEVDWWAAMQRGVDPRTYADAIWAAARELRPDALVLHKGWHLWHDRPDPWAVPPEVLWALRGRVPCLALLCFDDPAGAPVTLELGIAAPMDLWLTSCPGIADDPIRAHRGTAARVEEFWLAWDERVEPARDPDMAVEVAITGHPYHQPFPPPHHRGGFATPRRDLALGAVRRGMCLGVWGPPQWLDARAGGDPRLGAWYRGWIDPSRVHVPHGSAAVTLATHLVEGRRYDSGRIPFVMGAGGVLVHEDRPGLRGEVGDAAAWFAPGDAEGALDQAARVVADPALRARMAAEGRALVMARHTWAHRAARLVELCAEARRITPA